jgi:hypothetical protein
MMVNNEHWHELLKPEAAARSSTDEDRRAEGAQRLPLQSSAQRSPGQDDDAGEVQGEPDYEPVLTKYAFTPGGAELDHYRQAPAGLRGLEEGARDDA